MKTSYLQDFQAIFSHFLKLNFIKQIYHSNLANLTQICLLSFSNLSIGKFFDIFL